MDTIIQKLNTEDIHHWTLEEKLFLLDIYFIFSKKESQIFDLIYTYHECSGWENIFNKYNKINLDAKVDGVEIAIERIREQIKELKNK